MCFIYLRSNSIHSIIYVFHTFNQAHYMQCILSFYSILIILCILILSDLSVCTAPGLYIQNVLAVTIIASYNHLLSPYIRARPPYNNDLPSCTIALPLYNCSLPPYSLLFCNINALCKSGYFSPRRGCPRVLKLCMGS